MELKMAGTYKDPVCGMDVSPEFLFRQVRL